MRKKNVQKQNVEKNNFIHYRKKTKFLNCAEHILHLFLLIYTDANLKTVDVSAWRIILL